ncbi:Clp protease N-terminal domain-containing protein [Pseudoalteromonas sp. MMG005]|uniref:Clp protease N-terminal domain-containing protein n=1 Tax=Pseudoalteromonas sp. MMG005 TaxID=2822682 RepID=UPI001B3A740C|nr:Clp protease N-terminal domain-containing protein [Pseudoalteromonas sp. MMG005]MBQ4847786.1 Clp protease N-terminal domain-containing protein [Pseudoalteromonas sp. MMG005]
MISSFFRNIKMKIQDMKTISQLCLGAEQYAQQYGESKPGAEHFLLASLDLQDGSAQKVLAKLGVNHIDVKEALKAQHNSVLASMGVESEAINLASDMPKETNPSIALYDTKPSGQMVMKKLYENNKMRKTPLKSIHVIEVVLSMQYGTAIRVLQNIGVDLEALKKVTQAECY